MTAKKTFFTTGSRVYIVCECKENPYYAILNLHGGYLISEVSGNAYMKDKLTKKFTCDFIPLRDIVCIDCTRYLLMKRDIIRIDSALRLGDIEAVLCFLKHVISLEDTETSIGKHIERHEKESKYGNIHLIP